MKSTQGRKSAFGKENEINCGDIFQAEVTIEFVTNIHPGFIVSLQFRSIYSSRAPRAESAWGIQARDKGRVEYISM